MSDTQSAPSAQTTATAAAADVAHSPPPAAAAQATASHPPPGVRDPTEHDASSRGHAASTAAGSTELADLKVNLRRAFRQFPDFPIPGIDFLDILPVFASPTLHQGLIRAMELHIRQECTDPAAASSTTTTSATTQGQQQERSPIDVVVGLEARGFLFGPSLALKLGAGFVPVRKKGKLPGPTETASFKKEYGEDHFEMQRDAIQPGQRVIIVDDIIATGGTAAAASTLVKRLGGELLGYFFILQIDGLNGKDKLTGAPSHVLM